MAQKRIVIPVSEDQYQQLAETAFRQKTTLANLFREAVGLPLERRGVKREQPAPAKKTRKPKA